MIIDSSNMCYYCVNKEKGKDKYPCDDCYGESCHFEGRPVKEEIIKILELSEGNYYVRPNSFHSNFACVGNPLKATSFAEHITMIPLDVARVFKEAKFVSVRVNWEVLNRDIDGFKSIRTHLL